MGRSRRELFRRGIRDMTQSTTMFRQEAIDALDKPKLEGAPLHLLPVWTKVAYWFVVALVIGAVVYSSLASVNDYAQGPAVVRVNGRLDLTTSTGGTAMDVPVKP